MTLPPSVTVVIIVEHNGRVLLIEEERGSPQGRVWYFPCGALEPGAIAGLRMRSGDVEHLFACARTGRGLPLSACRLFADGRLEGFFA